MNKSTKRCFGPLRLFALVVLLFTFTLDGKAQDIGQGSFNNEGTGIEEGPSSSSTSTESDGTGFNDNVTDAPVDGGISILLIAGAAYGVRRVRRKR
jgi:hypothetical protein